MPFTPTVQRSGPVTDVGETTYTEDELKSILQVDDSFLQLWKDLFGGMTSLQSYARGISEHPEDTERTKAKQAELKEALGVQYILEQNRYRAEHSGVLTGLLVSIGGTMYHIGGTAAKAALSVPEFLAALMKLDTWVRVGEGILGVGCLVFGLVLMAKDLGVADTVLPIGKLTSLVKKGAD